MTDIPNRPKVSHYEGVLSTPIDSSQTTGITISPVPDYTPSGETLIISVLNPKGVEDLSCTGISAAGVLSGVTRGLVTASGGSSSARAHGAGIKVVISNPWQLYDDINTASESKVDLAGDTMTGLLQFSGTDHAGIRLISLTTAQRIGLTPANGDMVYDSDFGQGYQYVGGSWYPMDVGTSFPNASTTVAGKVEEATDAEVGAGTAAGGTGAQLYINPASVVKTSSGAGDENKLAALNASGQFADGFINGLWPTKATLTAKGSIYGATAASTPGELAVGSNDYVIVADSGESTGLKWESRGFAVGLHQFDMTTATGTENIAHGLNKAPRMIKFSFSQDQIAGNNYAAATLCGHWVSGTNQCLGHTIGVTDPPLVQDITNACISFQPAASEGQVATVSAVDGTNFTLSWTKTGTPVGTLNILWEAFE